MRRICAAFLLVLALLPGAAAQDVQVTAAVDSETVPLNETLQLTITVTGSGSGDVDHPRRSRFPGFRVVSGPNVSTQFQWINGRTSSSKSFIYTLLPEKEGQLTIDPIEVAVGSKVYKTQPVTVRVTAPGSGSGARRRRSFDPFGDDDARGPRVSRVDGEIFVAAEIDRASAFPGQQVTLSYNLYTQVGVSGLQIQESPPLTGFWVEDLQVDPNPPGVRRIINGREYQSYAIKKQALFANAAGKLIIVPATFAISVRTPGDFFGLFGQRETIYRKTKEVALDVRPFPAEGRPLDFNNGVGSFNFTSSLDKTEAATGDAVSLRLKLSGRGNLKMIGDLSPPAMPDFTIYSSKHTENVRPFEEDLIGGDKTWEYVIVPKAPGRQTIPSFRFSYFDPQRETYQTLTTPTLELKVVRGSDTGVGIGGLSGINKQILTRQGTDINFIKLSGDLATRPKPVYSSLWVYLVAGSSLIFNLGTFLYQREQSRQSVNLVLARSRRARRGAMSRLRRAEKFGPDPRRFYDETAAALSGYLVDRFNLPEIAVTGDTLERTLTEKSVDPETLREIIACIQECDFGRFVSASASPERMRQLAGRIRKVIDALERI